MKYQEARLDQNYKQILVYSPDERCTRNLSISNHFSAGSFGCDNRYYMTMVFHKGRLITKADDFARVFLISKYSTKLYQLNMIAFWLDVTRPPGHPHFLTQAVSASHPLLVLLQLLSTPSALRSTLTYTTAILPGLVFLDSKPAFLSTMSLARNTWIRIHWTKAVPTRQLPISRQKTTPASSRPPIR